MTKLISICVIAFAAAVFATSGLAQGVRVAISVGVNDYPGKDYDLYRAVNDADAVAQTFLEMGYASYSLFDVTLDEFAYEMDGALNNLSQDDEVVFFFSGHGVNYAGANAIVFADDRQVYVEDILNRIQEAGVRTTVLILDACRSYAAPEMTTRSRDATLGPSFTNSTPAARGSFILYSAGSGQFAYDGTDEDPDPNSLFTRELIDLLPTPGMSIQELALSLRHNVEAVAAEFGVRQTPAYYDEIVGEFSFARLSSGANDTASPLGSRSQGACEASDMINSIITSGVNEKTSNCP